MKDALLNLAVQADIKNPLGGVSPTFDFGSAFNTWWKGLIAAIWGGGILLAIVFLIIGGVKMANAGDNPGHRASGRSDAKWALLSLGGLVGLPVIVGGIIAVAS